MVTTTEHLKGRAPWRCDTCGKQTTILKEGNDRRRQCLECMPAKDRAVFVAAEGAEVLDLTDEE